MVTFRLTGKMVLAATMRALQLGAADKPVEPSAQMACPPNAAPTTPSDFTFETTLRPWSHEVLSRFSEGPRWIPPGQEIKVGSYSISSGLLYFGKSKSSSAVYDRELG